MSKHALVLREAGGLGDILQLGSVCDILQDDGFDVTLYTMTDPAILALAEGLAGVNQTVALQMTVSERRRRGDIKYSNHSYLAPVVAALKGSPHFVDAWCPAVAHEIRAAHMGRRPTLSRAQCFIQAAGYNPARTRPARLKDALLAGNGGYADTIRGRCGEGWVLVHLKGREPARSVPDATAHLLIHQLAERWPVVVFAYPEDQWGPTPDLDNVVWFSSARDRTASVRAVHAAFALCAAARAVVVVDSFMLHVSQALGVPAVLLSGPTDPVPLTAHYEDVHWAPPYSARFRCKSCYFQQSRGFTRSCREDGCGYLTSFDIPAVVDLVGEVLK